MNISIDDLESMLKSHSDNDGIYYNGAINDAGVIIADTSKPLDKDGKPLVSEEVYDGIAQREVNKAKGV